MLDGATRQRRLRRQLDALEADNFHEDPHHQQQNPNSTSAKHKAKKFDVNDDELVQNDDHDGPRKGRRSAGTSKNSAAANKDR